jgi:RNA polymerase sigma factor (sigma-70 family)
MRERYVTVQREDVIPGEAARAEDSEFEDTFAACYGRIARVVARVVADRGRAEEIAVDVFLKWRRHPEVRGERVAGWLYRTAVRMGLDELRRQARRARYERLFAAFRSAPATPEDIQSAQAERERVRAVLAVLRRRDAALLLLRGEGQSYEELAVTLDLNSSSVGTLLARAQRAFKSEYVRRYDKS